MTENHDAAIARDLEMVTEDSVGWVEDFVRERPFVAIALAVMVGAFLMRRLLPTRPGAAV